MPIQNDFLPFATGGSANVLSQSAYAALSAIANGYSAGVAQSAALNKTWRQASIMAAAIAQLIVDQTGQPVIDDGTIPTIKANLVSAIEVLAGAFASSSTPIVTTGGTTTLSATQYANSFITVTGVLASDATLVFPNGPQKWTVINSTTGAHTLTCKTAAGSGVTVTQGHSDTVSADGTNVVYSTYDVGTRAFGDSSAAAASTLYVDRAVAEVGGYYQDTGSVANAYVVTAAPPITSYVNGLSLRFRTTRANNAGCTLDAGAGAVQMLREDRQPLQQNDLSTGSITVVTYDNVSGSAAWLVNEIVPSELGNVARENIGQGLEDDGAGNLRIKLTDASIRRTASGIQTAMAISRPSGATAVNAASNTTMYVPTTSIVLTVAQTTTLFNGHSFAVDARNGAQTVTPNAADSINGGTAGAGYTVQKNTSAVFVSDGAGNIEVVYQTIPFGASPAPQYINSDTSVTTGQYSADTTVAPFTVTLNPNPNLGDTVRLLDTFGTWMANNLIVNPSGKTIMGSTANMLCNIQGEDFMLVYNGTDWRLQ